MLRKYHKLVPLLPYFHIVSVTHETPAVADLYMKRCLDIQNNSKTLNYRLFKDKLEFEKYFDILEDRDLFTFCHFRTVNHKLPIKYWRWNNIQKENRVCNLCNSQDLGDKFHYLLKCSFM